MHSRWNLLIKNSAPIELLNRVEAELNQFIGTAEQLDDITLLSIKRKI
jgi:serine phosphatase RsbU (regulator of sigma subunit)